MLKVKDWPRAKEYYKLTLKPLGYELVADWGTGGGFGVSAEKFGNIYVKQGVDRVRVVQYAIAIFVGQSRYSVPAFSNSSCCAEPEPTRMHVSLTAPTEQALREYYAAAVKNGGTDNGAPGPRDHVPGGVACFVIDLDNNNIECNFRP